MDKQTKNEYGFYSKVLNKPFDTLKELQDAEKAHKEELDRKEKLSEEKRVRAKEIEEALKEVLDTRKENQKKFISYQEELNKTLKEKENHYNELKNQFIKDYGSYHVSYRSTDDSDDVSVADWVQDYLLNWFK